MDKIKGNIWLITDKENKQIHSIDMDMIFHNAYLHITYIDKMGQHTFDNLDNWKDFSKKDQKGDIVILGKKFGAGSSRQQAVDCFIALGIQAIIAESFESIYKRNAINTEFPIIEAPGIFESNIFNNNDKIEIVSLTGEITNIETNKSFIAEPMSKI